ncbi:kinase-like protein [Ceratobasidium sp. AG-I]|nr:kinase-like protein [Ceratobasidium sp. AG-I]
MEGGVGRSLRYKIVSGHHLLGFEFIITLNQIIGFSEGLAHMHSAPGGPVMHGDLKAANIFIAEGFVPKIADFGLSRTAPRPQNQTTMQVQGPGTWRWMTPEAHKRLDAGDEMERPTRPSDIWSWAHVVYETITGQIPYPQHRGDIPVHNAIIGGELNPKPAKELLKSDAVLVSHFWPLLLRCWSMDPKDRPAIVDILQGSPFSKIQRGDSKQSSQRWCVVCVN